MSLLRIHLPESWLDMGTSNSLPDSQHFQQSVLLPVAVAYYGLYKRAVRSEGVSRTVVVA